MKTENNKNKLAYSVIISLLAVSLIGSWAYFLNQSEANKETIQESQQEISFHEDLKLELSVLEDEFKSLQKDSNGKDLLINAKDSLIINKQNEIRKLLGKNKLSDNEVAKAKNLIKSLRGDIVSYKEEIVVLQNKNKVLRVEKDQLLVRNQGTIIQRDSVKKELKVAHKKIIKRDSLLDTASTLKASNFNIEGVKVRNNGKEIETGRSRKVNKLKISFDIEKNNVAPFGPKDLYICLYEPSGTLVKFEEGSKNVFKSRKGKNVYYSDELDFDYNSHEKIPIAFDWEQEDFQKGNYKIVLYQNGYKVGEGIKSLK